MAKKAGRKQLSEAQKAELNNQEMRKFLMGKPVHCDARDQRIAPEVCEKVQSTAGCEKSDCQFWDSKLNSKAAGKPKSKSSKPRKASYQTLIRAVFTDKGKATLDELVAVTGADRKNTSVGVSILRNPKRMKNPMKIAYHYPTKTYFNLDHDNGQKWLDEAEAKHAKEKKAAAKAKRDAKKAEEKKAETKPAAKPAAKKSTAKKPAARKTTKKTAAKK